MVELNVYFKEVYLILFALSFVQNFLPFSFYKKMAFTIFIIFPFMIVSEDGHFSNILSKFLIESKSCIVVTLYPFY